MHDADKLRQKLKRKEQEVYRVHDADTELRPDKLSRILDLYTKLMSGAIISKPEAAKRYGVHERSVQRDIEEIRRFLDESSVNEGCINQIVYDRSARGYRLEQVYLTKLTNSEVLAIGKILLDSRAFVKSEMKELLHKLVVSSVPRANQPLVLDLFKSEANGYVEPRHGKKYLAVLWDVGQAIRASRYIEIEYRRTADKKTVKRRLKPAAIMFSEYYFYLAAFIDDADTRRDFDNPQDVFPTIYRIDRIEKLTVRDETFRVPYRDRFDAGEFRKRVQFMYGGRLRTVKFKYTGRDIDAVLDRLPTAVVLNETNGVYLVSAEVFGDGINIWLNSQGDFIEIVE